MVTKMQQSYQSYRDLKHVSSAFMERAAAMPSLSLTSALRSNSINSSNSWVELLPNCRVGPRSPTNPVLARDTKSRSSQKICMKQMIQQTQFWADTTLKK